MYKLFILLCAQIQGIIKEETYEYEMGQLQVDSNEQFITQMEFGPDNNFQSIRSNDTIVIFQTNLDFKGIQLVCQEQIFQSQQILKTWILEEDQKNKFYLINLFFDGDQKFQYRKIQLLTNNLTCFGISFINDDQIVIDCTDFKYNVLVIQDIIKLSTFIIKYGDFVNGKRFLITNKLNIFVINNNHLYHFCKIQNATQFKVCQIERIDIEPFYGYTQGDSNQLIVFGLDKQYLEFKFKLINKINLSELHNKSMYIDAIIFDHNQTLMICNQYCNQFIQILGEIRNIKQSQNYIIVQNDTNIFFLNKIRRQLKTINHKYDQDLIDIHTDIDQVYVLSQCYKYIIYQLSSQNYQQADQNKSIKIIISNKQQQTQVTEMQNWILIDDRFTFKENGGLMPFVGGNLNLSFSQDNVQFKFNYLKQMFSVNCSNDNLIIRELYSQIVYFYCDKILQIYQRNIDETYQKMNNDILNRFIQQYPQYIVLRICQISIQNIELIIKIDYQIIFVIYDKQRVNMTIAFSEDSKILDCQNQEVIALNDKTKVLDIFKDNRYKKFQLSNITNIKSDIRKHLIMGIQDKQLIVQIIRFYYIVQQQVINLCQDFIDYIILDLYLIVICQSQIIKYNQISKFHYQKAGNIVIYGEIFNEKSRIISSGNSYFYILFKDQLYIFDSSLPSKFSMIQKIDFKQCQNVQAIENYICCYSYQLICYYIVNQLQIKYDEDNFEYNQVVGIKICAQNIFDSVCLLKPYRIQSMNHKIILKQQKLILYLKKSTNLIQLKSDIFIGSVDLIKVNQFEFQRQCAFMMYYEIQKFYDMSLQIIFLFEYNQYLIYKFKQTNLIILNTKELIYKIINLGISIRQIFVYKSYLFVYSQISIAQIYVFQCNFQFDCSLEAIQSFNTSLSRIISIQNNKLTLSYGLAQYQYQIFLDQNQQGYLQLVKKSISNLFIDICYDIEYCEMTINFDNQMIYKISENEYQFNLQDILNNLGIQLNYDEFSLIKFVNNCQILFIGTKYGFYFLRLNKGDMPQIQSELVPYKNQYSSYQQIKLYDQYILFQYKLINELVIYQFDHKQITDNQYIFHSSIQNIGQITNYQTVVHNQGFTIILQYQNIFHLKVFHLEKYIIIEDFLGEESQINVTFINSNQKQILQIWIYFEKDLKYQDIILNIIILFLITLFICLKVLELRCEQ